MADSHHVPVDDVLKQLKGIIHQHRERQKELAAFISAQGTSATPNEPNLLDDLNTGNENVTDHADAIVSSSHTLKISAKFPVSAWNEWGQQSIDLLKFKSESASQRNFLPENDLNQLIQRAVHILLATAPHPVRETVLRECLLLSASRKCAKFRGLIRLIFNQAKDILLSSFGLELRNFKSREGPRDTHENGSIYYFIAQGIPYGPHLKCLSNDDDLEFTGFLLFLYAQISIFTVNSELSIEDFFESLHLVDLHDLSAGDLSGHLLQVMLKDKDMEPDFKIPRKSHDEDCASSGFPRLLLLLRKCRALKYIEIYFRDDASNIQAGYDSIQEKRIYITPTSRLLDEFNKEIFSTGISKGFFIE